MNLYLNSEQEHFLKALLDKPSLQILNEYENSEQLIQDLKSKVNKKKIDKKAILPSASFIDKKGKELLFSPRNDNGAIILKANKGNYPANHNGYFSYDWDFETSINIANYLHNYAIFTGDNEYDIYDKAYSDEFNVFKDEVERSVNVSGSQISFTCYTGDKSDDDWTYLLPNRVKEALRMIVAYIFLHEEIENHFNKLDQDIQKKHSKWLSNHLQHQ